MTPPSLDRSRREAEAEERILQRRRQAFFFWEDRSNETPHPDTLLIEAFFRLATRDVVTPILGAREGQKKRKYGNVGVKCVTLIMTAGGAINEEGMELINRMTEKKHKELREQSDFRRDLMGGLSSILLQYAAKIARCLYV